MYRRYLELAPHGVHAPAARARAGWGDADVALAHLHKAIDNGWDDAERLRYLDALGMRPDVAVEAAGSPAGFAQARRILRPGGILVLKSTYSPTAGQPQVDFSSFKPESKSSVPRKSTCSRKWEIPAFSESS